MALVERVPVQFRKITPLPLSPQYFTSPPVWNTSLQNWRHTGLPSVLSEFRMQARSSFEHTVEVWIVVIRVMTPCTPGLVASEKSSAFSILWNVGVYGVTSQKTTIWTCTVVESSDLLVLTAATMNSTGMWRRIVGYKNAKSRASNQQDRGRKLLSSETSVKLHPEERLNAFCPVRVDGCVWSVAECRCKLVLIFTACL
jgi:hypothetical protein